MRIVQTPKTYAYHFESMEEAWAFADKAPAVYQGKLSGKTVNDGSWSGAKNWPEALALAKEGDAKLGEKIKNESSKLASYIFSTIEKSDVAYDVQGQVIDMGKYLNGDPECCLRLDVPDSGISRVLDIGVITSVACGIEPEQIQRRGIVIATVVKTLESLGISCRLNLALCNYSDNVEIQVWLKFKDFGEPLRLNQLAFALTSPTICRRLGFVLVEAAPKPFCDLARKGYGSAMKFKDWHEKEKIPVKGNWLEFPILNYNSRVNSDEGAREWAIEIVKNKLNKKEYENKNGHGRTV